MFPWVRWCHEGVEDCHGSGVYVYEGSGINCCGCSLRPDDVDFVAETPEEMRAHLKEHAAAGHHVPRILYDDEVRARAEAWHEALGEDCRLSWYMNAMRAGEDWLNAHQAAIMSALADIAKRA